ncbi:MAG: hypothetical protein ACQUHE_07570 [Bacteroidia bacterium]
MNNTFDIQRFGLLLKRQWLEFGKIYLISLIVLLGVFLCFYGYAYYNLLFDTHFEKGNYRYQFLNFRVPLFATSGLIFGTVVASSYFSHLGQKSRAIIDLLTPASVLEKFFGGVFFATIIATISFFGIFYFTDLVFVMKIRSMVEDLSNSKLTAENGLGYFFTENNPNDFKPLYVVPFFITSIFLLGSIYFNKFHYIKTAIAVMIFSGIWAAIIGKSGQVLFEGKVLIDRGQSRHMFNNKDTAELWITVIGIALTLIFWAITYVRLKEKEV